MDTEKLFELAVQLADSRLRMSPTVAGSCQNEELQAANYIVQCYRVVKHAWAAVQIEESKPPRQLAEELEREDRARGVAFG